jgi:hypothetical protein
MTEVGSTSEKMTDSARATAGPAAPPALRTRVAAILSLVGRLGLVVVVISVGWWTVNELTDSLRDPSTPSGETPATTELASAERLASPTGLETIASLATGGRWEFSDGSAALSIGTVPETEIDAYWAAAPMRSEPQGSLDAPTQAWERSLLDLVRAMNLQPKVAGESKTYVFPMADFRGEVVTQSIAGVQRLVAARAALRDGDDVRWRTIELAPQPKSPTAADRLELLPYPPGTERLATRYDLRDGVGAEFARVPLPLPALLDHARRAGSEMIFPDLGTQTGTREGFCVYNGRTIRVVLWQPPGTQATTILAMALGEPTAAAKLKPINVP